MSDERKELIDALHEALRALRVLVRIDNGTCSYCHGYWLHRVVSRHRMADPNPFDGEHREGCFVETMRQLIRTLDRSAPCDTTPVWVYENAEYKRTPLGMLTRDLRKTMQWDESRQRWNAGFPY